MNAAHLHKLKQLYTPSQAARTLSWLSEFCTTEKNPAACLARCVDQHVDQHEPLAYILGSLEAQLSQYPKKGKGKATKSASGMGTQALNLLANISTCACAVPP